MDRLWLTHEKLLGQRMQIKKMEMFQGISF